MSAGSSPKITTCGDYTFRNYPSDIYQGKVLAEKVFQKGYKNVVGIDMSQEAVDYCKEKGIENIYKVEYLSDFLAKNVDKFDFIVLKSVIAHFKIENVIENLKLIRNALKTGGSILIETFNASILTGTFAMRDDFTHKSAFTDESLYQVLYEAGFKDINIFRNKIKIRGMKTVVWIALNKIWVLVLRMIYTLERGVGDNPKILSKLLIATAKK